MYDKIVFMHKKGAELFVKYERIRNLREDQDLKQEEVAKALMMKQQQYSEYERGKREIPFYKVIDIANFYNVSLDYIAGRTNRKEINR